MKDRVIDNLADENERRVFLGLNADGMEGQSFKLQDRKEVELFSKLFADFVKEEFGPEFHWIDLPLWYDKCQKMNQGARLFMALLDLKITLGFLLIDTRRSAPDFNSLNRKDGPSILSDPQLFRKKMKSLHENIDLAIRYRSFFDKYMGILVLIFCEKEYDSFIRVASRKKAFIRLMNGHIDPDSIRDLSCLLSGLDDKYRTAEVHQSGRMRKWVLSTQDLYVDKAIDFMAYTNAVLDYSRWLDGLRERIVADRD